MAEMEEPGGLPSMGSHRVRHNWSNLAVASAMCLRTFFSIPLFILLIFFSFAVQRQRIFSLLRWHLLSFAFVFYAFGINSWKKSMLRPRSGSILPVFSPGNIIFWGFTYVFHSFWVKFCKWCEIGLTSVIRIVNFLTSSSGWCHNLLPILGTVVKY